MIDCRKTALVAGLLIIVVVAIAFFSGSPDDGELRQQFLSYAEKFDKKYEDEEAQAEGFKNFKKSQNSINDLNMKEEENIIISVDNNNQEFKEFQDSEDFERVINSKRWKVGEPKNKGYAVWGHTPFSDLSREEFKTKFLDLHLHDRIKQREKIRNHKKSILSSEPSKVDKSNFMIARRKKRDVLSLSVPSGLPQKVDWRKSNVVTPIKQQNDCGACWAFSTVETAESMYALKHGAKQQLSVQQVINCATNGNLGCRGGDICYAVMWMTNHNLVPESQYPLTDKDGVCLLQAPATGVQVNSNFTCDGLVGNEEKILEILAYHGPVAVAVDATNWQFYVGGIIRYNCETNNNHAVQIVGYDMTSDPPYYIIRNSWGTSFGDKGYLYVAIGNNLCGIAREVVSFSVK